MSFMSNIIIVVLAYFIDKKFGEFSFIKNPMIMINDLVNFVEKKVYKDSVSAGVLFVVIVLGIMSFISLILALYLSYFNIYVYILLSSFIASIFLSQNMLDEFSCKQEDVNNFKNYTQTLQEHLIAPIFYLLLFGITGIILYKTILVIDTVLKNQNKSLKNFSQAIKKVEKAVNFLPKKITLYLVSSRCRKKLNVLN